jgi:hypothetical protein
MRFCSDIGMFVIDRGIPHSCVHATSFCLKHCYNNKLYHLFPKMRDADLKNDAAWATMDPASIATELQRKRRPTDRVRLCSRGEPIRDYSDIERVKALCLAAPDTLWWIPTRAWRHPLLAAMVQAEIMPQPNAAVLASTDPTTTPDEFGELVAAGWSTMHFGDEGLSPKPFKCPKTWGAKVKGACEVCINGCFKPPLKGQRVDVLLRKH